MKSPDWFPLFKFAPFLPSSRCQGQGSSSLFSLLLTAAVLGLGLFYVLVFFRDGRQQSSMKESIESQGYYLKSPFILKLYFLLKPFLFLTPYYNLIKIKLKKKLNRKYQVQKKNTNLTSNLIFIKLLLLFFINFLQLGVINFLKRKI